MSGWRWPHALLWLGILTLGCIAFLWLFAGPWVLGGSALPTAVGDFWFHGAQIKAILAHGWYPAVNESLGAPWGQAPFDMPSSDGASYALVRLIGVFASDWATVAKIYFVIGYVLVAVLSFVVLVAIDVECEWAAAGALIVAFLPYHILRIPHLWLATYVAVPISLWLALALRRPDLFSRVPLVGNRAAFLVALAALALASSGAYYAFFGVIFIVVSGAFFALSRRAPRILANASVVACLVALGVGLNIAPFWRYQHEHGSNRAALPQRDLAATEGNSLKLAQLLLPPPEHRVPAMRALEWRYASAAPLVAENRSSALGIVGVFGLLLLAGSAVARLSGRMAATDEALGWLTCLAGVALALASVGGVNSLFVLFVTPLLRGWNRISVFVGFFAAAAVVVCASRAARWLAARKPSWPARRLSMAAALLVAAFAAWDQTPVIDASPVEAGALRDRDFFARVEAAVGDGGLVYQLPYLPFPEGGWTTKWPDYSHLRGYLYTRTIRWSYGAIKGRDADLWQRMVSMLPPPALAHFLADKGFSGIYVDRLGYADNGADVVRGLEQVLGPPAVATADGNLLLFRLQPLGVPTADFSGLFGSVPVTETPPLRGRCNVDSIRREPAPQMLALRRHEVVDISGWVGDPLSDSPPEAVRLFLVGNGTTLDASAHVGMARPDVIAATGSKALARSGFIALLAGDSIPAGTYKVSVGFADRQGPAACATRFVINVAGQ